MLPDKQNKRNSSELTEKLLAFAAHAAEAFGLDSFWFGRRVSDALMLRFWILPIRLGEGADGRHGFTPC
jgi:hypothetical protein